MTVTYFIQKFIEGLELVGGYFLDPHKRIFYLFLISSLLIATLVFMVSRPKLGLLKYVFHKRIWFGHSPTVDYLLLLFNGFVKVIFLAPLLVYGLLISFYVKEFFLDSFGYPDTQFSSFWIVAGYTLTLFIVKDFSSYFTHYLFHRIPILWRFHKVHHSATVLNPITQYRIHPVELIVNNLVGILVFGLVTGYFDFLSNGKFHLFTILGVNAFNFTFMLLGANLRHSHVKLTYPSWLESILISPRQHQIHHSQNQNHFDRNFGSVLSIWDNVFGTLVKSNSVQFIRFGLGAKENKKFKTFWQNIFPR